MAASSKIRVGFIGLNAPYTGAPTGTSWAAQAHLPYLRTSSKYEIVALQNSSAERAAKAIEAYGFDPEKVKAYGTPEDLANDPNVDLVVSSIRVDRHANSLIPSIKANKDVFVEWPIEASYEKAKELTDLIRAHNVRNVVGLQGGYAAVATRVKSMIDNGEIGKMESSTFIGKARGGGIVSQHVDYFVDRMVGGNLFTIGFGHAMEFITKVLGPLKSHQSLLLNQHPTVSIVSPTTNVTLHPNHPSTVPNQIALTALLHSSALLTLKMHSSATPSPFAKPPAPGTAAKTPALDWRIFGTKGEIRITCPETWALNAVAMGVRVECWRVEEGRVEEVVVEEGKWEGVEVAARNIGRLYEAFADARGQEGEREVGVGPEEGVEHWYPDFEYALKRHELIEEMYRDNGFV